MMKGLLLILLSLQVFLLFTIFTSTDAAALVTDDQQPSLDLAERTNEETRGHDQQQQPPLAQLKGRRIPRKYPNVSSYCSWNPGACYGFRVPPTKPPTKPKKIEDIRLILQAEKPTPQSFPANPFRGWRPGQGGPIGGIDIRKLQDGNKPTPQRFPFYPFGGYRPGGGALIGKIEPKDVNLELQTAPGRRNEKLQ